MISKVRLTRTALLLTGSLVLLSLAACNKTPPASDAAAGAPPGAVPLDPNAPATPPAYAPVASALPPAPPAPVSRPRSSEARYGYVARAEAFNNGVAGSPPDYAVDYQGARPWYWRAQNGASRVVEATPDGDRYYYYAAGADQPYLVRDPRYAYGYENGQLAVVYDAYGRALPDDVAARQADLAGRYLARAQALREAAQREQHEAAYAAYWQARQDDLRRQQQDWASQRQKNADWQAWQAQNAADANAWRQEADARHAYDHASDARSAPALPPAPARDQPRDQRGPGPAPGMAVTPQGPPPADTRPGLDAARRAQQDQIAAETARRAQQAAQAQTQAADKARLALAQQQQDTQKAQARLAAAQQQQETLKVQAEAARRTAAAQQAARAQVEAQAANQARLAAAQRQQLDVQKAQTEAARRAAAAAQQATEAKAREAQALQAQQQALKAKAEAARRAAGAKQPAPDKAHPAEPNKPREDRPDLRTEPPK